MSNWFYEKAGTAAGPFSEEEIRELYESSVLRPHTRIRKEGTEPWVELEKSGLDMSEAAHANRPGSASGGRGRTRTFSATFPPPAGGHGPHFTAHGGRIEFHAPCRGRKSDCLKVVALGLLLTVSAFAVYLWMSA